MVELAHSQGTPDGRTERALRQAGRELLLAQSSDWAFIMKTGTTVDYAVRRTKEHLLRFHRLYEQIKAGRVDEGFLGHCEGKDNLFPFLNWRHWA
jgi:1,4-alpha-glucan branching enzyme